MKEQIRTPGKELNKMEKSNLPDTKFKTLFVRMLKEPIEDLSSVKKIQLEMKDTLIKIKNNLQGINGTVDEAENQISNLEYKEAKNKNKNKKTHHNQNSKKKKEPPK